MTVGRLDRHEATRFVERYLAAIERSDIAGNEDEWFTPDFIDTEWPNPLSPDGRILDLLTLREVLRRGTTGVTRVSAVTNVVADGSRLAVEVTETLVPAGGALACGVPTLASVAIFLDLRDGRICRQRLYRCMPAGG